MKTSPLHFGIAISTRKAVLLVCFIVLLGFILVDSKRYAALIDSQLISSARAKNWFLTIENSDVSIFGYSAGLLHARQINSIFGIGLENVHARPRLFPIMRARWGASLSAILYNGSLESSFEGTFSGSSLQVSADAQGISASGHPMLDGFGIRSGTFDIHLRDLLLENEVLTAANVELEMHNISKPEVTQLPLSPSGLNVDLVIPSFSKMNGKISCQLALPAAECSINISSSLLTADGKVMLTFEGNHLAQQRLNGNIELQEEGTTAFGKFLPLISGGRLKETDRSFSLRTSGSPRAPSFILEPSITKRTNRAAPQP